MISGRVTVAHDAARDIGLYRYAVLRPRAADRLVHKLSRDAAEALGEAIEESAHCAASAPRDWLGVFASALRDEPRTPIAVLARANGVTPTHAARVFARRFGQTPAAFRKEQRLRTALQALPDRAQSLAQVAASAGYSDQAHMTRDVAAATGATPSRLRVAFQ